MLFSTSLRYLVLGLFLSLFFSEKVNAQGTANCIDTDACFEFGYKFAYTSKDKVTLTFSVKTTCGNALSHVAIELPAGAKAGSPANVNQSYSYNLENTTNNPFYSVKFETKGEGPKKGKQDSFTFTLSPAEFNKLTSIRIQAKAGTSVGTVSFGAKGCNKPEVTLTGPEAICNLSTDIYTYTAGPAQAGTTYTYTLPNGLFILEGDGTNTIKVQAIMEEDQLSKKHNISVKATNKYGSSTASLDVVVKDCQTATPLPVEFTSFEGTFSGNAVKMIWATASEHNNDRFEVERSSNGRDFVKVGQVKGNGTTLVTQQYTFSDTKPVTGTTYYRLKQVDLDGASEYSKTIALEIKETNTPATPLFTIEGAYPNPFQDQLKINFTLSEETTATFTFYNAVGQIAFTQKMQGQAGTNQADLTGLNQLPQGIYIMKMSAGQKSVTQRLVKAN